MAKKMIESRISPPITKKVVGVTYDNLDDGDCFILNEKLYIRMDVCDQEGILLEGGGGYEVDLCETVVIPVDIKITWKEKK